MDFRTMDHVYQDWLDRRAFDGLDCDTMYYKESIKPEIIDSTIKILLEKRIFSISELYLGDRDKPFRITQAEQTYLINELKKLKEFKWPAKMFPQSRKVKSSDLHNIFVKTGSYPKAKSNKCSVYGFSRPIYIRNETICLYLQEEQYKETYSQVTFGFLKMNEGQWQEYADVYVDFGKEIREEVKEDVENSSRDTTSVTSEQLDVLARKIFIAFKNNQLDTLINLTPTFDERLAILKLKGISAPREELLARLREADKDNISKIRQYIKDLFEIAVEKKIDFKKATYGNFERHDDELTLSLRENATPSIYTSMDIYFYSDNRKFMIKVPEVYNVEGELKISAAVTIDEVK